MNSDTFAYLVEKVRPHITKQTTNFRKPISAEEQLAVALRYFGTGESYGSLQYQFRISKETIRRIIPRVCFAIVEALMDTWMPFPKTSDDWLKIADGFQKRTTKSFLVLF